MGGALLPPLRRVEAGRRGSRFYSVEEAECRLGVSSLCFPIRMRLKRQEGDGEKFAPKVYILYDTVISYKRPRISTSIWTLISTCYGVGEEGRMEYNCCLGISF